MPSVAFGQHQLRRRGDRNRRMSEKPDNQAILMSGRISGPDTDIQIRIDVDQRPEPLGLMMMSMMVLVVST